VVAEETETIRGLRREQATGGRRIEENKKSRAKKCLLFTMVPGWPSSKIGRMIKREINRRRRMRTKKEHPWICQEGQKKRHRGGREASSGGLASVWEFDMGKGSDLRRKEKRWELFTGSA